MAEGKRQGSTKGTHSEEIENIGKWKGEKVERKICIAKTYDTNKQVNNVNESEFPPSTFLLPSCF